MYNAYTTPVLNSSGSFGEAPQQNWLQKAVSGLSNYIEKKPEQFAITADAIGQNLAGAPYNPFAGVGTMLGRSSLANKAAAKTRSKQDILMQLIKGLSAKNLPGGNKITITTGADGSPEITYNGNLGKLDGPTSVPAEAGDPHEYLRSIAVE